MITLLNDEKWFLNYSITHHKWQSKNHWPSDYKRFWWTWTLNFWLNLFQGSDWELTKGVSELSCLFPRTRSSKVWLEIRDIEVNVVCWVWPPILLCLLTRPSFNCNVQGLGSLFSGVRILRVPHTTAFLFHRDAQSEVWTRWKHWCKAFLQTNYTGPRTITRRTL